MSSHIKAPFVKTLAMSIFVLSAAFAVPGVILAQAHDIMFEELSVEEGLSQSIVFCVTQDHNGFMWFGTEDGLNRFDGYAYIVLRHDPNDPFSLTYNHILSLLVDSEGALWAGTMLSGLDMYDASSAKFIHHQNDPGDPSSLSHNLVRVLFEDANGALWVGTDGGLNSFDRESGVFTRYLHDPDDQSSLSHNTVRAICEDQTGSIWVGTDSGLNRFNRVRGLFKRYMHDPGDPSSLSNNAVRSLFVDRSGTLWIGTDGGGLNRFDHQTGTFTRWINEPGDYTSLSHNSVFSILEDRAGTLWIGTNGGGLNRFDRAAGIFTSYVNDPNDPSSISYNEIYDIFEDRTGVMWIGTYGGGVNKFDSKRKKFVLYRAHTNQPNSLSHPIVWSIYEDADGILWIGTHGGGLNRLDRDKNIYTHYRSDPDDPRSLSSDIVRFVFEDSRGVMWLGTHGGGLCRFDKETGYCKVYRNDPYDPRSLSHDELRSIYEDRSGTIWIGTNGGGLNRFDRESDTFTRFRYDPDDPNSIGNDYIRVFFEDSRNNFWIGTQGGGLNRFDRDSGAVTRFINDPDDKTSIKSDYVFSILEDDNGMLWCGTWGGGLVKYDPESGVFSAYTEEHGLPSNSVYGALMDERGRLWLSTNYGLSMFDPKAGTFKNYSDRDGLQGTEYNGGSFFKSKRGEMFFGGIYGFNSFYPSDIRDNPYIPPVVITSFKKLNEEVKLDRQISDIREVKLTHRDYVFSFEFAALEFSAPEKNQYAYKMVGLDDNWIYTDSDKRYANYTTLPPGDYEFMVKASNNDGVWNENGTSIKITITPPFWNTWWFRAIIVMAILFFAFLWYQRRSLNIRMKVELRTAHDAQMSIMPQTDPEIAGFDISGICIPANEVGGDFYDYFWMNEEKTRLGVAVGDVSGKAMQAAMIAVMSSGMINSRAEEALSPREILTQLNRSLYRKTDELMFTALCFAAIDTLAKEFTFTIAGFNEPLMKSGESVMSLSNAGHGIPLGAFQDSKYKEATVAMKSGDVLLLFTDGITEARNNSHDFYDDDRLRTFLASIDTSTLSAGEIKQKVIEDVRNFTGNTQQEDDMTIVVIKAA